MVTSNYGSEPLLLTLFLYCLVAEIFRLYKENFQSKKKEMKNQVELDLYNTTK